MIKENGCFGVRLACVASVSVRFRSKKKNRGTGFLVLIAPYVARSLNSVLRSLLLNRTETLATQASVRWSLVRLPPQVQLNSFLVPCRDIF